MGLSLAPERRLMCLIIDSELAQWSAVDRGPAGDNRPIFRAEASNTRWPLGKRGVPRNPASLCLEAFPGPRRCEVQPLWPLSPSPQDEGRVQLPSQQISDANAFKINLSSGDPSPLNAPAGTLNCSASSMRPSICLNAEGPPCCRGWVRRLSGSAAAFMAAQQFSPRAARARLNSERGAPSLSRCQKTLCSSFPAGETEAEGLWAR